ncbi:hypothetical protein D3C87_2186130 [compost metagenome]
MVIGLAVKEALVFRIAEFVLNVGPEQMHDDELLLCRIGHHLFKWRQHVGVIFASTLGTLLVHIELLVSLL